MRKFLLLFIFALSTNARAASEYQKAEAKINVVKCTYEKQQDQARIFFADQTTPYSVYEKARDIDIKGCQSVQINGMQYFTVQYVAVIDRGIQIRKSFTYEIALLKGDQLVTVRSEVIQAIPLLIDSDQDVIFDRSLDVKWGRSKTDKQPMLQMVLRGKEKTLPYLLKFNPANVWFENNFPEL
ncbi:MAG: hypothetical protein AB7N80_13175 [Bdellovibrionales bacterium]